ncbi:hypothetical protein IEQ34_015844 [Dendrobium chrysotoxum]|uniref:Uncharacterized protein n=1 Tax=Dendrobium chrysotoxum TaxID=161865 RepID=A0AAV7GIR3_DENCH|nr:hypothetical protein IEQ34_015844 [Dendrobium chrysotoxum]
MVGEKAAGEHGMKEGEDLSVEVAKGVATDERVEEERRGRRVVVEEQGGGAEVAGAGVHGSHAGGKGGVGMDAV